MKSNTVTDLGMNQVSMPDKGLNGSPIPTASGPALSKLRTIVIERNSINNEHPPITDAIFGFNTVCLNGVMIPYKDEKTNTANPAKLIPLRVFSNAPENPNKTDDIIKVKDTITARIYFIILLNRILIHYSLGSDFTNLNNALRRRAAVLCLSYFEF